MLADPERMFMNRLAARFGVVDVDGLHDSMTPELLREHRAMAIIDGWYHGRAANAEILAAIHNAVNRMMVYNSSEPEKASNALDWKSASDFIKDLTTFGQRSDTSIDVGDLTAVLEKRFG